MWYTCPTPSSKTVSSCNQKYHPHFTNLTKNRNRHTVMIFGGYILRLTFEVAHCCAARFSHSRPRFISLDSTTFDCPVPVGSILEAEAMVVYTAPSSPEALDFDPTTPEGEATRVQVRVKANVRDVHTGKRTTTGTFAYTFGVEGSRRVLPTKYSEFMEWIIAKR
jgi:acyl-coenzyme A thioesterase 9